MSRRSGNPAQQFTTFTQVETVLTVISCPRCGVPAQIAEHFGLPSTEGLVAHVVVDCAAGHHFRMAADRLQSSNSDRPHQGQPPED
jgi:hypothetical protein